MNAVSIDQQEVLVLYDGAKVISGSVIIPIKRMVSGGWVSATLVFRNAYIQDRWRNEAFQNEYLPHTLNFGEKRTLIGAHDAFLLDIQYSHLDCQCIDQ